MDDCDYDSFLKLKYSTKGQTKLKFLEEFDQDEIDSGQILMEL